MCTATETLAGQCFSLATAKYGFASGWQTLPAFALLAADRRLTPGSNWLICLPEIPFTNTVGGIILP
jgi:hypothetical protein